MEHFVAMAKLKLKPSLLTPRPNVELRLLQLSSVVVLLKARKHGSNFLTEPKFSGFCMAKLLKIAKFVKNSLFFKKNP